VRQAPIPGADQDLEPASAQGGRQGVDQVQVLHRAAQPEIPGDPRPEKSIGQAVGITAGVTHLDEVGGPGEGHVRDAGVTQDDPRVRVPGLVDRGQVTRTETGSHQQFDFEAGRPPYLGREAMRVPNQTRRHLKGDPAMATRAQGVEQRRSHGRKDRVDERLGWIRGSGVEELGDAGLRRV
jgi:hypothetical protein